ncbi:TonB-dependent receptor [Sphingomonas cannabina]|uniref:TonB-dependent receptor n=1 Tax=Sphingomonas cannabina TaxID=2899123 RepID=UPI001F480FB2|nr:TonB-dependent receptor [Sphingomonas cannabina]UIJ44240.1 TonB-dependent receptor [Sphingomonas cannabina]
MRSIVGIPLLLAAAPALAQEAPDIVVTGQGLEEQPGERGYDTVTIDRAEIEASASSRLEDVLRDVAGLQQFRRSDSRSANPTSQGITLRGIGGNASSRALLILDGVPQSDPFGGWVAFPAYALDRLGAIRVTRGGGSGYAGAGALAGTVELESARPDQLDPLTARLAYGSRDSVEAGGSAALVRGNGFATVSGAYARGDGFIPVVAEDRGPADRPAPYESASGAVRGVIALGGDTELQANLSAFTDRRDRGVNFTANSSEGADASVRIVSRGRWGWSALAYLQTRGFSSQFASIADGRTGATMTLNQFNVPATGLGGRIEVQPPLGSGIDLRLGADVRAVSGRTQELYTFVAGLPTRRRDAGGENRTMGLFADGSVALGDVTLSLGGRIDWWRIMDGSLTEYPLAGGAALTDNRFPDRDGTEATGRAAIAWKPASALTLRAAAYRGWRLPTLNELYRPFRVGADATAANAALAPEKLTGFEGGIDLTPLPGVRLSLTAFDNRLDDAIANVTVAKGPGTFPGVGFVSAAGFYLVRQNLDRVRSRGIEADANASFGAFSARVSWSHVDPRVEASGTAAPLDGLRPAQTPRDTGSLSLAWTRPSGLSVALTGRYVASQFEDDQNREPLDDAATLDARVAVPVGRSLLIEARGENITDTRIEAGIGSDGSIERAAPRTLWIGTRFRLR